MSCVRLRVRRVPAGQQHGRGLYYLVLREILPDGDMLWHYCFCWWSDPCYSNYSNYSKPKLAKNSLSALTMLLTFIIIWFLTHDGLFIVIARYSGHEEQRNRLHPRGGRQQGVARGKPPPPPRPLQRPRQAGRPGGRGLGTGMAASDWLTASHVTTIVTSDWPRIIQQRGSTSTPSCRGGTREPSSTGSSADST